MPITFKLPICALAAAAFAEVSFAQSLTGNAGSANISPDDRAVELRIGTPGGGEAQSRVHVEQAFSGWYKLRVIAAFNHPEDSAWDYRGLTFENWLQWAEEASEGTGFNGGLRLSYTFSEDGRPDEAAVRLTLTDKFASAWEWRANLIAGIETTDDPADGVELESRLQLTRALPIDLLGSDDWRLGAEAFSEYGNTSNLAGWDDQAHQIGPVAKAEWKNGVYLQTAVRFGLTDASDDVMAKVFIGREF